MPGKTSWKAQSHGNRENLFVAHARGGESRQEFHGTALSKGTGKKFVLAEMCTIPSHKKWQGNSLYQGINLCRCQPTAGECSQGRNKLGEELGAGLGRTCSV